MKRNVIVAIVSGFVFTVTYLLLFTPGRPAFDFELAVGEKTLEGIVTPVEFEVPLHEDEYEHRKKEAAAGVPVFLRLDTGVWPRVQEQVTHHLFEQIEDTVFVLGVAGQLSGMYDKGVFDLEIVRQIYSGDDAVFLSDSTETSITLTTMHHLDEVKDDLTLTLRGGEIGWPVIGSSVMLLEPNVLMSEARRDVAIQTAMEMVSPIDTVLFPGDTLIPPGGLVTVQTMRMLEALRESDSSLTAAQNYRFLAGRALLLIGLIFLALLYIHNQMKQTWEETNRFLLLCTIWLVSLAATGLVWLVLGSVYGMPFGSLVTFGASLTSIFFDRKHASIFSILFALALGGAHPHPFTFVLITFVSGSLAGYFVWDLRRRSSVPKSIAAAAVGGIISYGIMVLIVSGFSGSTSWSIILELIIAPVIGVGAATSVLLPLEKMFGVYTVLAIDEVKDRHHPLLKELSQKAMGTWQHSQAVADLASEAARAIGADTDLVEAAGLFHDIGKLNAPEWFIENMDPERKNPHDSLSPSESARVIIAHVADGVELAKKHRLPGSVKDIIEQHHGDSTTRYFLEKARKQSADPDSIDFSEYSYSGPKPESTESAIVMLADAVSSAVQALSETSPEAVANTVKRIIEEKDIEGQFDECYITRAQLKKIFETFLQVLKGRFHERVTDYPHGRTESDSKPDTR